MKWLFTICFCLASVCPMLAQDVLAVRSRTDQFVVLGRQTSLRDVQPAIQSTPVGEGHFFWYSSDKRTNDVPRLHLVPGLVAVACERIKEGLLYELGEKDTYDRKVFIQINDRISEKETKILAGRYAKGWLYSIEFPQDINAERFAGTIIDVLLTSLANRHSTGQQLEVPAWLLAGFTSYLQAARVESFALQPNLQLFRDEIKRDPAYYPRLRFANEQPLTFDQMSWPENLSSNQAALFQDSAQLFVCELLRLKNGRDYLRQFLAELPNYKNWQFAFLAAFKPHFSQLIEVEKWWALQFSELSGRDLTRLLSPEESWDKLKSALDVPAQIHLKSDRLPIEAKITLQEVIQQWDMARQEYTLRKAVGQLHALRLKVQPEMVSLVDEYRKALEKYLEQRFPKERRAKFNYKEMGANPNAMKKSVCRQLDDLDEMRSKLRREMTEQKETPAAAPVREIQKAKRN